MNSNLLRPAARFVAISLLALTALAGCSTRTLTSGKRTGATTPAAGATLAVVPFENLTNHRHAGLVLTDLATTILHAKSAYDVREVGGIAANEAVRLRRLETDPWERQVGLNTAAAAQVGAALKVGYVLAGSVGEYGFVDGFGETANVGVTLRLVRVDANEVVWAGTLSRKAATTAFNEESVHRLAHEVLLELLGHMQTDVAAK